MDELFCIRKNEIGSVPEVEEGCLAELVYVHPEGESWRLMLGGVVDREGNAGGGGCTITLTDQNFQLANKLPFFKTMFFNEEYETYWIDKWHFSFLLSLSNKRWLTSAAC